MKFHPRYGTVITDGLFMTSRDGRTFHRWDEAFIRPGSSASTTGCTATATRTAG